MEPAMLDLLDSRFAAAKNKTALITDTESVTYAELLKAISEWEVALERAGVLSGDVVVLRGDFGRTGIASLFALLRLQAITILVAPSSSEKEPEFTELGSAQWQIDSRTVTIVKLDHDGQHPLYHQLRAAHEPGIVLFSSGSTGVSKGTVHSGFRLLEKFREPGKDLRTLAFLLFDHIAGLDTLFYSLANTSTLILPTNRMPKSVCEMIEAHRVEVLPTAPSFLNLLLLSGALDAHDLSSLKIITYGSEMMSESVLAKLSEKLPNVRVIQKYGTSETGALPSQSLSNTSTWVKLGGDGFAWRVRDGLFEVQSKTAMLGYLNAASPFTEDGWFKTGDRVETDGDYVRFLGRDSDIINVGGQKVYPAEVEALILELPEVAEVAISGEPHAILGAAVVAHIHPDGEISQAELRKNIRAHLANQIEGYKIPQKFKIVDGPLTTSRFKKIRRHP
ncbi:MAG: fatty acid--CoA ligase family protein, partial [Pseudomonadota bacterium]